MKKLYIILCFIVIFVMLILLFKSREMFSKCRNSGISDSKLFQDAQNFTKQVSEFKQRCNSCGSKRNNENCPVVKGIYAPCNKIE